MAKDYYELLGVTKDASKDEIKKAFHKLAHKHHPDKNGGDDAKFKEVNEAYQTLSDDKKRAQYDRFGSAGPQMGGNGAGFGGFDPNGFDFSGFQNGNFDMGDIGDIFSDFFHGGMGGGRPKERRGHDISTEMTIDFTESVFGVERKVALSKTSACESCEGSGAKKGAKYDTCKKCEGRGQVRDTQSSFFGNIAISRKCDACDGQGKIPSEVCEICKGKGVKHGREEITVRIPAGANNGEMFRMPGMGEAVLRGIPGDLYIRVNVTPHKVFRRDGDNIRMDLKVKISDVLLGGQYKIETLDGAVTLKIPEGVSHGEVLRVKEKGVASARNRRGDLLITISIDIPSKLSRKAREAIEVLKTEGM